MAQKGKWFLTTLAVIILCLVGVDIWLTYGNQSLRAEVGERQQFISQSIQLDSLNREVITVLANLAVKTNDEQLKNLLTASGISFSANPTPPAGAK
jgi:cell division protein FtsL